jgi:hypothetical protein
MYYLFLFCGYCYMVYIIKILLSPIFRVIMYGPVYSFFNLYFHGGLNGFTRSPVS